jgi:hypothetical protein
MQKIVKNKKLGKVFCKYLERNLTPKKNPPVNYRKIKLAPKSFY